MRLPQLIEETEKAFSNIEKRPFDRFVLGPFMIWFGLKSKGMNKWPRRVILAAGIYQIIYAWEDYQKVVVAANKGPQHLFNIVAKNTIYAKEIK